MCVKGQWKYLYRAVDKAGRTVDFLLTAKPDRKAALRFLRNAIDQPGLPEKITLDKSGANTAAVESYQVEQESGIELQVAGLGPQVKYVNNIVEQDHRPSQTNDPADARIQIVLVSRHYACQNRTHAHDRQRPIEGRWPITTGAAILFTSHLNRPIITDPARPFKNFATEPMKMRR